MKDNIDDEDLYTPDEDLYNKDLYTSRDEEDANEELYMSDVGTSGDDLYTPEEDLYNKDLYTSEEDEDLLSDGIGSIYSEESLNSGDSPETYNPTSGRRF